MAMEMSRTTSETIEALREESLSLRARVAELGQLYAASLEICTLRKTQRDDARKENKRLSDIYGDPDAERISVPKVEWSGLQRWKDRHKCCLEEPEEMRRLCEENDRLREKLKECSWKGDSDD